MNKYKLLTKNKFEINQFSIVPIRNDDRFLIMKWRNEQMYHLRQNTKLTKELQDKYFNEIISKTFQEVYPSQLLFSYLEKDELIGYGGIVHINWKDKNAEISFLMNTELESSQFVYHWTKFLYLIEEVAFNELNFHKLFTYAFDLRPRLYEVLESCNYKEEARLKQHTYYDNKFIDVVIHAKINE
jgi:RimJ/RimL family protein N-acetyltransferase